MNEKIKINLKLTFVEMIGFESFFLGVELKNIFLKPDILWIEITYYNINCFSFMLSFLHFQEFFCQSIGLFHQPCATKSCQWKPKGDGTGCNVRQTGPPERTELAQDQPLVHYQHGGPRPPSLGLYPPTHPHHRVRQEK